MKDNSVFLDLYIFLHVTQTVGERHIQSGNSLLNISQPLVSQSHSSAHDGVVALVRQCLVTTTATVQEVDLLLRARWFETFPPQTRLLNLEGA